jgi:hypothetical protein
LLSNSNLYRYNKEEGATVNVDKSFQFKDLVLDAEGATWSMFGGGVGDDAGGDGDGAGGGDGDGEAFVIETRRQPARRAAPSPAAVAAAAAAAERSYKRMRQNAVAAAARVAATPVTRLQVMGLTEELLGYGRGFVRVAKTEDEMVETWHQARDGARDDYKRRRRQALRHQKTNRTGGGGAQ